VQSRFAFVVLAILATSTFAKAQDRHAAPPMVSIVQLLSSPDKYDGKRVVVFGFLTIGQENDNLYFGKTDYDNALEVNSIWVELSDDMVKKRNELQMKYVRIVGVFHVGHAGHRSGSLGGIGEISDCDVWSDPDHPFSEKLKGLLRHDSGPGQQVLPK
jgi:hypothetical protein